MWTPRDELDDARAALAERLSRRGIDDRAVLEAVRAVPRHRLVPAVVRPYAYEDRPLAIGLGQTVSQPYVIARMLEALHVRPGMRVLEVGTGSGYQTALLAELGAEVYSLEIRRELLERARAGLLALGLRVALRHGDGFVGWPEAAPFSAIVVSAAPREVPPPLIDQLAEGGRLVLPRGDHLTQILEVHERQGDHIHVERLVGVRFVPMVGEAERAFTFH